jgi:hypothetical protein
VSAESENLSDRVDSGFGFEKLSFCETLFPVTTTVIVSDFTMRRMILILFSLHFQSEGYVMAEHPLESALFS